MGEGESPLLSKNGNPLRTGAKGLSNLDCQSMSINFPCAIPIFKSPGGGEDVPRRKSQTIQLESRGTEFSGAGLTEAFGVSFLWRYHQPGGWTDW